MDVTFTRYVELDQPCWVQAVPLPEDRVGHRRLQVSLGHGAVPGFTTVMTLAPLPAQD
jgi:hypothetical protein